MVVEGCGNSRPLEPAKPLFNFAKGPRLGETLLMGLRLLPRNAFLDVLWAASTGPWPRSGRRGLLTSRTA